MQDTAVEQMREVVADLGGTTNAQTLVPAIYDLGRVLTGSSPSRVTLEMYGGAGDGTTINDAAFEAAVESGYDIEFASGCTYKFSGDVIDLASIGRRINFYGDGATLVGLSFRYNITSQNKRAVTSLVDTFPVCFRGIKFANNTKPIIITTGNVIAERCNFVNCTHCFGFPEYYVDYFHAEDCACYSVANFVSAYGYDGEPAAKGMYGNWITFERCSFGKDTIVYTSSPGHVSMVFARNCLHGRYVIKQTTDAVRSYLVLEGCEFEQMSANGAFVAFDGTTLPSRRAVTLRDSNVYSEAMPSDLDGITLERCTVNYGNNHNYGLLACERGRFERFTINGYVWFDEDEFFRDRATEPVASVASCWSQMSSNTNNLQVYDASHTVRYAFATSLERDRLYFGGQSKSIVWTSDLVTTASKCPVFNTGNIDRTLVKNVYMHVFKVQDGTTYRAVIPATSVIRPTDTASTLASGITFADEPQGVFGCKWEAFTGTVAYETT